MSAANPKKSLKLSVKTLETRIAPGACRSNHNEIMETGDSHPEAEYWNGQMQNMEVTQSTGASVPVIGIN